MLYSAAIDSPIGRLVIAAAEDAVVAIAWADTAKGEENPLLVEACHQLEAYFDRRLSCFDLPLKPAGSAHEHRVWAAMQRIPYGQTRCYGELAMEVGSAPRAVGRACGRNPIPIMIPCHRVLARGGIGGYSGGGGLATKRALLTIEGAGAPFVALRATNSHASPAPDSIGIAAAAAGSSH